MKDAEARRRRLLYETRNLYQDKGVLPAVHPRYRASHASLYPGEEELPKSSLKLRIVISLLCFVCYLLLDYGKISVAHVNSTVIREQITGQMQLSEIAEVLKQL